MMRSICRKKRVAIDTIGATRQRRYVAADDARRRISGVAVVRWFAGIISRDPNRPAEAKAAFFPGKPHFRIFSGLGLAFRPTLGIYLGHDADE